MLRGLRGSTGLDFAVAPENWTCRLLLDLVKILLLILVKCLVYCLLIHAAAPPWLLLSP